MEYTQFNNGIAFHEDCFKIFPEIPDGSVDFVLADMPYGHGITECKWDTNLPLDQLWNELRRIVKERGAICLFAAQPFTTTLIGSNLKNFKYTWVWEKSKAGNYMHAKQQPLRASEDICVFYRKQCLYNPQMVQGEPYHYKKMLRQADAYGTGRQKATEIKSEDGLRYPRNIIYFATAEHEGGYHPTQKPIALLEYMIKTYTNPNEVVLDFTAGSFSTAVAAENLNRRWIGIEKEQEYYDKGIERIKKICDNFNTKE